MNWKHKTLGVAAGLVLAALPAYSQTQYSNREERVFWLIDYANRHEIGLAKLVSERSNSQQVRDFADQVLRDDKSADEQILTYATTHHINVDALRRDVSKMSKERLQDEREVKAIGTATGEYAWTWEHTLRSTSADEEELRNLGKLKGAAFDRAFIRAMVEGHQSVVDRLENARSGGAFGDSRQAEPDLRGLIDNLLPTIQQHLEMARKLQDVVAKG